MSAELFSQDLTDVLHSHLNLEVSESVAHLFKALPGSASALPCRRVQQMQRK